MKPVDQSAWLATLEQRAEAHIQEAIDSIQNLDEALLNRPAPNGGWSIGQCLAHLNSYGAYYLPRVQQTLLRQAGNPGPGLFVSSWLGNYLTRLMEPTTGHRAFHAARQHQPPAGVPACQVVATFIDQQETLLSLLRTARTVNLNAGRIPISVARWIRLPVGDVLQFLVAHTERHLQQARRNR